MKYPVRKRRYQYESMRCTGCDKHIKRHRIVRCATPTTTQWLCHDTVRNREALLLPTSELPVWHKHCHQQFHAAAQLLLHGAETLAVPRILSTPPGTDWTAALPRLVAPITRPGKGNTMVFRRLNRGS